jgi:hypothetical protein
MRTGKGCEDFHDIVEGDPEKFLFKYFKDKQKQETSINWYSWVTGKNQYYTWDYGACMMGLTHLPFHHGVKYLANAVFKPGDLPTTAQKQAGDKFIGFITDKNLSPWRKYADQLFPSEPYIIEGTDVNSLEFRQNVGFFYKDPTFSLKVFTNFCKAARLARERPLIVYVWDYITSLNPALDPSLVLLFSMVSIPLSNAYQNFLTSGMVAHSFLDRERDVYVKDLVRCFCTGDITHPGPSIQNSNTIVGCDAIWLNGKKVTMTDPTQPHSIFNSIMSSAPSGSNTYLDPFTGKHRPCSQESYTLEDVLRCLEAFDPVSFGPKQRNERLVA